MTQGSNPTMQWLSLASAVLYSTPPRFANDQLASAPVSWQVDCEKSLTSAGTKRAGKISDSRECKCIFPLFFHFLSFRVFNHFTSPLYCNIRGYAQNISIRRQRINVITTLACTTGILGSGGGGEAIKVCGAPSKTCEWITWERSKHSRMAICLAW